MGEFPSRSTQIKPGEVRNPTGRNQFTKARERFGEVLAKRIDENQDALVEVLVRLALAGDGEFYRMLIDRVMPKVAQVELSGGVTVEADEKWAEKRLAQLRRTVEARASGDESSTRH